jgi:hypothetical protein
MKTLAEESPVLLLLAEQESILTLKNWIPAFEDSFS